MKLYFTSIILNRTFGTMIKRPKQEIEIWGISVVWLLLQTYSIWRFETNLNRPQNKNGSPKKLFKWTEFKQYWTTKVLIEHMQRCFQRQNKKQKYGYFQLFGFYYIIRRFETNPNRPRNKYASQPEAIKLTEEKQCPQSTHQLNICKQDINDQNKNRNMGNCSCCIY